MASLSGGDKLEKKLAEIAAKAGAAGTLRVGFLEGATYPDKEGTPVAAVAAISEYGAPGANIPARSFFRPMIAKRSPKWPEQLGKIAVAADYDMNLTLDRMGQLIASQLQKSIIAVNSPALSPITVMLRGMKSHDQKLEVTGATVGEAARRVKAGLTNYGASTKPLDETGHMLNSVSYEVSGGSSSASPSTSSPASAAPSAAAPSTGSYTAGGNYVGGS